MIVKVRESDTTLVKNEDGSTILFKEGVLERTENAAVIMNSQSKHRAFEVVDQPYADQYYGL